MGITIGPYTTPQGFQVEALYIRVNTFRLLLTQTNTTYHCIFTYEGFKSHEDKQNGCSAMEIPESMRQKETIIPTKDFLRYDIFHIAYSTLKNSLAGSLYTVQDVYEPNQPKGIDYRFNSSGWDIDGFNSSGYNVDGYDKDGFNSSGYDKDGYDRNGYNASGYNRAGFNQTGYNQEGYDAFGFNQAGYDKEGYDRNGYDMTGYNKAGYDREGYDKEGYNAEGYSRDGTQRSS